MTSSRSSRSHLRGTDNQSTRRRRVAAAGARAIEAMERRLLMAQITWDGGGADENWTTAANWVGDVAPVANDQLLFPDAAARKTDNNNDFPAGTAFNRIDFTGAGYTLNGNAINLVDDINATNTTGANTVNLDVSLTGGATDNQFFTAAAAGTTLTIAGDVNKGTKLLTLSGLGDVTVSGVISGSGGLNKNQAGNAFLTATNTYTGITSVNAGSLYANNTAGAPTEQATGTSNLDVDGNLRGSGAVGDTTIGASGAVLPGGTSGGSAILGTEDIAFASGADYRININGNTAGTGYDQLNVTGTVALGGATLEIFTPVTAAAGESFVIINNDGTDAVSGTFAGLAQGATVTAGTTDFTISYTGGTDNNDVVLTAAGGGGGEEANDPPVNTVPGAQTITAENTVTFTGANTISVTDPDAAEGPLRVVLTATGGTVTLAEPEAVTIEAGDDGINETDVAFTGTVAQINQALAGLIFTGTQPFGGGTIQIQTSDQGNTGTGGAQTDTDTITINEEGGGGGDETNAPPVIAVPGAAQSTAQNTGVVFSADNNNRISIADPDAGTEPIQVTLTATQGTIDLGTTTGLTFTAGDGDGDTTSTFTGTLTDVNAALSGMTFVPTNNFTGQANLQITANDQGNTGTGGPQSDTETVNINVQSAGGIAFSAADYTVNENAGIVTVTVRRSGGAGGATSVDYATSNGTATEGQDYLSSEGTVQFADGQETATFDVAISDDIRDEANETIIVTLSNPGGAGTLGSPNPATITITDNDATPTLSIDDVAVAETDEGTQNAVFTVILSAPLTQPVTVTYGTSNGGGANGATAGEDYTATSGTLTFAAGETIQTIEVPITADEINEPNETFNVTLSNATGASLPDDNGAVGIGTIIDDDTTGLPGIFVNDITVEEGDTGTQTATFTVQLSVAPTSDVTVAYTTTAGTATAGQDFAAENGTLTFTGATRTQTVTIDVTGDEIVEGNETFALTLSQPSNAALVDNSAQATIIDDDTPVGLSINNATVAEGNTGNTDATFTITLSAATTQIVTVGFATAAGTATAGQDFTQTTGTATFPAGTTTQTVTVPIVGDADFEPDETFTVVLSNPQNALLTDAQGLGTITNDDEDTGPRAVDDFVIRPAGAAPVTINVLDNDDAFDALNPTVTIVDQPAAGGTAAVGADNRITFTPAAGAAGNQIVTFTYRVTGGDESDTATVTVAPTGVSTGADPLNPAQQALFVVGGDAADQFRFRFNRRTGMLAVSRGREVLGEAAPPAGSIVVYGGSGDDRVAVPNNLGKPVVLFGGSGNDRLTGSRFNDILIGGDGNDTITGGAGNDILIGSQGADRVTGAAGDDILIAGPTDYDVDTPDNRTSLRDLLTAWTAGTAYATRVTNIRSATGVGASGASLGDDNVRDDTDIDNLNGGPGQDYFLLNKTGANPADRARITTKGRLIELSDDLTTGS